MKIQLFVLCDAATQEAGKLFILGTFDHLCASQVPFTHPACAVALRLRFARIEMGSRHEVRIDVVDSDGGAVVPFLRHEMKSPPGEGMTSNLVLNFQGIVFRKFGDYSIDLAVDGRQEASIPLRVVQMERPVKGGPEK